jgi:hypothetical protein
VPWDSVYHRYWQRFLTELAQRYSRDPSLLQVTINGHNQRLEMHMPRRPEDRARWRQLGWSTERVESDWKSWIDFFARTFPENRLALVVSPMYGQSIMPVVEDVVSYAVSSYGGRLILMIAVLNGRSDQKNALAIRLCMAHPQVVSAQETVASFQDARRQGNVELFVYNMRQLSPLYVRLWHADAENADLCRRILAQYSHARAMSVASYQQELKAKGLYTTTDTYQASPGGGHPGRGRGRRRGFLPFSPQTTTPSD